MGDVQHNCGVAGVFSKDDEYPIGFMLYEAQRHLENRGEDSHGVAISFDEGIVSEKQQGTVPFAYEHSIFKGKKGRSGISHNRYRTAGLMGDEYTQPMPFEDFFIGHNGTIFNAPALARRLLGEGMDFNTGRILDDSGRWTGRYDPDMISDTEVAGKLIAQKGNIIDGIKYASRQIQGGYAFVILDKKGDLYAVRDPRGMKPLCIGRNERAVGVFSESSVFSSPDLAMDFDKYVYPGEIFHAGKDGEEIIDLPDKGKVPSALDIFELVYFANRFSVIDGIPVALFRRYGGIALGRKNPDDKTRGKRYRTVPVELSGIDWAIGFAEETGHPYASWMHRKKYSGRSFIAPSDTVRKKKARQKLALLEDMIRLNPFAFLLEDSIVRGNTLRKLSNRLRFAGAKEIHVRVGYPPVVDVCHGGGIDMHSTEEHLANQYPSVEERMEYLGLDSLVHNEPKDLIWAANKARNFVKRNIPEFSWKDNLRLDLKDFCTHCATRRNPFRSNTKS